MDIFIRYFDPDMPRLEAIDKGDWIDLRTAEPVSMKKNEFCLIPLGVAMHLPLGYEAHIVPRSSTFRNFKIIQVNSMGVVDESYSGDNDQWFFPAYAVADTEIPQYARICQFRIVPHQPSLTFTETEKLGGPDRGGHGSTGIL